MTRKRFIDNLIAESNVWVCCTEGCINYDLKTIYNLSSKTKYIFYIFVNHWINLKLGNKLVLKLVLWRMYNQFNGYSYLFFKHDLWKNNVILGGCFNDK